MVSDDFLINKNPAIYHRSSSDPRVCQLARTELRGGRIISTMWVSEELRINKNSAFDTIVLNSESDLNMRDYQEYTNLLSAKKGHLEMVIKWFYGGMDEYPPSLRIVEA